MIDYQDEAVYRPKHYNSHPSGIEAIQVTEHFNFCIGNAIKYLWRADEKGDAMRDLEKARWYVTREIERRNSMRSHLDWEAPAEDGNVETADDSESRVSNMRHHMAKIIYEEMASSGMEYTAAYNLADVLVCVLNMQPQFNLDGHTRFYTDWKADNE